MRQTINGYRNNVTVSTDSGALPSDSVSKDKITNDIYTNGIANGGGDGANMTSR